jgi:parvulin-like peptidyl-prolyl isomerase
VFNTHGTIRCPASLRRSEQGGFIGFERKEHELKRVALFITALSIVLSIGCTKREELVIARVEDKEITVTDFEKAVDLLDTKYLPETDDLEGKKEMLDNLINKEVMALKARDAGYEREEWFQNLWARFRNPFLISAMMDQLVRKSITVTEEEIDYYYDKMHNEYTLSQLVVLSKDLAWELRDRILAGEDFAELAKQYSIDASARNGGFVGSDTVGRILWWVEEALFDMNEGDISTPLNTTSGYALIKVHRIRRIVPDEGRDYAEKRVRGIKEKKGTADLRAKVEKDIELTWYPDAIDFAYNALPEDIPFEDIVSYKVTRENAPELNLPEKYYDMIMCTYTDGSRTLGDFAKLYEAVGLPERPRRDKGKEAIVQLVHRKVFDEVLAAYAEQQAKVLEIPEVREAYDLRKEQFLVQRLYEAQITDEVVVSQAEIEEYYNEHKDEIVVPEQRDFSIILVGDQAVANEVALKAKSGGDFAQLAMKYSSDPQVKENKGRTGLTFMGLYPDYDAVAFMLSHVGAVSDPFETPRGWAIVKLEGIQQPETPTLIEARQTIETTLKNNKAIQIFEEKLKEWREGYPIEIFENNLKKAKLKRTRL